MTHLKPIVGILLFCLLGFSCQQTIKTDQKTVEKKGFLSISGQNFVDDQGRQVILNGINYVTKDPKQYFLNHNDAEIFKKFKSWGFNAIRFGMSWRGIEPEPGQINEAYLQEIDKRVKLAEENGLWIILDMHQDLYGGKYGNGAPEWATFDEGFPHETGEVWSDAYLISPAIQKVFDNFWQNTKASDGVGIQDHYINVWKIIAKRYANSTAVAGFDIMNEPFPGSQGANVLPKLLEGYGAIMAEKTGKVPDFSELVEMWGNEKQRTEALKNLNDKKLYLSITQNAYDEVKGFEEGDLSAFYQKTRDAIREVAPNQILFLEHSYFSNLGVLSSFKMPLGNDGQTDPLTAYAPHGYDLVTDTDAADDPGFNRVEVIFEQISKAAKQKERPIWIGEWGAFYMGRNYSEPARQIMGIVEQQLMGQAYWAYWSNIETQDYFAETIARAYPMRVNGINLKYQNHFDTGTFEMSWTEDPQNNANTVVFYPDLEKARKNMIITPKSEVKYTEIEGSKGGWIEIVPIGKARTISVRK